MLHLTESGFSARIGGCPLPAMVMFYAGWCGKCAMMKPIVEEIERKYHSRIQFCEVDVAESPRLAGNYGVDIVPAFAFFRDGQFLGSMRGIIDERSFERRLQKIFRIS